LTMITLSPDGKEAYISDAVTNYISVLDLSQQFTIKDSLKVNSHVTDIAVTASGQFIYTCHPSENKISVIDIQKSRIEKEITVGAFPKTIALFPPAF